MKERNKQTNNEEDKRMKDKDRKERKIKTENVLEGTDIYTLKPKKSKQDVIIFILGNITKKTGCSL